jgi:hypothetical protein
MSTIFGHAKIKGNVRKRRFKKQAPDTGQPA